MHIVLLSGGSGKRLWPLSTENRSKQFIKIFKRPEDSTQVKREHADSYESMMQRVYRQIKAVDKNAIVTIAAPESQVPTIRYQLGEDIRISVEPSRRDTFPAIALACAYLYYVEKVDENESIIVCPVDPYVEDAFFEKFKRLNELLDNNVADLVLMGIEPSYPSEKYGYIIPIEEGSISKVSVFKEKPKKEMAEKYISEGGLWNSGVFAFKLCYMLQRAHELIHFIDYLDLLHNYEKLSSISFDYAIVEQEKEIAVLRYAGEWKDLGTWDTFIEALEEKTFGDVRLDEECDNVHVINELGISTLVMGCKNVLISASSEGILVSNKSRSDYLKPFVDALVQQEKTKTGHWGDSHVLDITPKCVTSKTVLSPKEKIYYNSDNTHEMVWIIVSGTGRATIDNKALEICTGDIVRVGSGCEYALIAGECGLQFIEILFKKSQ